MIQYVFQFLILIFFISISSEQLSAQNENNIWYFGNNAGINFNGDMPSAIEGALSTDEGTSIMCDGNSGETIFYTDGTNVFDATDNVMPNGVGLGGDSSSTQSALIVPRPGSDSLYYIFTTPALVGVDPELGFRYSVVDRTLNGGLGDIITINNLLLESCTEKVAAIQHCNGIDFWIVTHEFGSNAFYVYLLSDTGIDAPVVSNVGMLIDDVTSNARGELKFSTDGQKLAVANDYLGVELYDFDINTGVISNPITLYNDQQAYGVCFSPDNTKLYVNDGWEGISLYQFNLELPDADIPNSKFLIGTTAASYLGGMQIGMDGRIYVATYNATSLGVIKNPNEMGWACNYVDVGFSLDGYVAKWGLPNFIGSYYFEGVPVSEVYICDGDTATITANEGYNAYLWSTGDTLTSIKVTEPGTYWVELTNDVCTYLDSVSVINASSPILNLGGDVNLCNNDTLILDATFEGGGVDYFWQDGSNAPVLEVTEQGWYWVQLSNDCVTVMDSIYIGLAESSFTLGSDRILCDGETFEYDASIANDTTVTYLWQDGSTNPTFTVSEAGTYWVEVNQNCGTFIDSVTVGYGFAEPIDLGPDQDLCAGEQIDLDVTRPDATYLWQDGTTLPTLSITEPGTYWVAVNTDCAINNDTIIITDGLLTTLNIGADTSLCMGSNLVLSANGEYDNYLWNDGSTLSQLNVVNPGVYWLEVSNNCGLLRDSIFIESLALPTVNLGNDLNLCEEESTVLNAQQIDLTGTYNYLWQDGTTNPSLSIKEAGLYQVSVSNACGEALGSISVNYKKCDCDIVFPTAFSPNGDKLNDTFHPHHLCEIFEPQLNIYDRWGKQVYQNKSHPNNDVSWDGNYQGTPQLMGAYVYLFAYTDINGERKKISGNITLLR